MDFHFQPIGVVHSCFKEKFGIPRQPGLVMAATSTLELYPPYDCPEAFSALEGFSHIWVVFVFHQAMRAAWKPTVRPPRLGGNERIGVFASRSPFRPNPVGISAVALEKIECTGGRCRLIVRGADLLDGTPVLDIKPYVPYADALPDALGGFAAQPPENDMVICFSESAARSCTVWEQRTGSELRPLIEQVLLADPRPAYRAGQQDIQSFGVRLYDLDVHWIVNGNSLEVTALLPVDDEN